MTVTNALRNHEGATRRALRWSLLAALLVVGCAGPTSGYISSYVGGYHAGRKAASEGSRAEATKQKARHDLHTALRKLFDEAAFEEGYADGLAGKKPRLQTSDLE